MTESGPDTALLRTLYSENLTTMRTLQAHAFSATLRIFGLDLLVAGGLLTNVVQLGGLGKVLAGVLVLGFHLLMYWYLNEQAAAYRRRKGRLKDVVSLIARVEPDLVSALASAPDAAGARREFFTELRIYRVCLVLGGAFAMATVLFPDLLT